MTITQLKKIFIPGIDMSETKYRSTRATGLNWLGEKLGGLAGKVVKEKKKHKKRLVKKKNG